MTTVEFANHLQNEVDEKGDALIAQYPERIETENGYEPYLDWGEYILDRISANYPNLSNDETNDLLEEVRNHICV